MHFERVSRSYGKNLLIIILVVVVIGVVLITNGTRAKYSVSESVPLIKGTINYKPYDFKIMGMYQENNNGEYEEIDEMPSMGYIINEERSYCYITSENEKDSNARLYTNNNGEHVVSALDKGSKCYIWFDKKVYASDTILASKTITEMPAITGISIDTSNTIYKAQDDDGDSYVFRGNPSNNWVQFGGYYWRIIRINGDGSIRMIYNGTSTATTGTGTQIGTSAYNTNYNDNAYVGFMYGTRRASTYAATHINTNKSNVMSQLESWYTSSGLSNYAQYIDQNAGFCNDRQTMSGVITDYGTLGYATQQTAYAPWGRLYQNNAYKTTQTPSLKCSQASQDLFTMSNSNKGNKKLSVPLGLITSDEVVFAGGFGGTRNQNYYLYTNQTYWTMSPYGFSGSGVLVFGVYSNGNFNSYGVNSVYGGRPVINIRADVTLTGNGSSTDPFLVS